jgi:hypothetical protein
LHLLAGFDGAQKRLTSRQRQLNATKAANMAKRMTVAIAIPHRGSPKIANPDLGVTSLAVSSSGNGGRTAIGVAAAFCRDAAARCVAAKREFMIDFLLVTWVA